MTSSDRRQSANGCVGAPLAFERNGVSILSPLRYPGSKRRLAGYIGQALRLNDRNPEIFIEPFAGGASVALQLLNDGIVKTIGLADRDPLVASFWKTVFFDADWLVNAVRTVDVSLDKWTRLRKRKPIGTRQQALACLFLNRTSFSGILADTAGPIGGHSRASNYDIDCRFPRETLVKRIRQAESLADRVRFVWNTSWPTTLRLVREMQGRKTLPDAALWYLDPPFFKRADRLYRFYFEDEEHLRLRDSVICLDSDWILSYDSPLRVEELYSKAGKPTHVEALYSGSKNGHTPITEVIVTNLDQLPERTRLWRKSHEWKAHRDGNRGVRNGIKGV